MIIAIEAERANRPQKTGVELYAKQLILHLARIDRENKYVLYLRTQPQSWFLGLPENFIIKVLPFPIFWTQARLSLELWLHPVDVLFVPASALPLIHPKKSVAVIHDCAFLYYPEMFTWWQRTYLHWAYKFIGRFAWKIIAVSQTTKEDLVTHYKIFPDKITVVHHGYEPWKGEAAKGNFFADFPLHSLNQTLPEKYVLFLSTLQPRKNLHGLIAAFRQLKDQYPELPHTLLIVGKPGWKYGELLELIKQNADIVTYMQHVSEDVKWQILRKASLLCVPSFYEGFGMWVLEAFAAKIPIIVSSVSSLPEVAGDAAMYCNPKNIEDIKRALKTVLFDKSLADKLVVRGVFRLEQFSWYKCAEQSLKVFMA